MKPPDKAIAPAEVLQDQGEGAKVENEACTEDSTSRKPKRKLGNVWREVRHLFRCGPNGRNVFETWKWTGEPLQWRGA